MIALSDTDLIEHLGVYPEYSESDDADPDWRRYTLARDGMRLVLDLDPCDAAVLLFRDGVERPLFRIQIVDCREIRWCGRHGALELLPPRERSWRTDLHGFLPVGVRLQTRACLAVEVFDPTKD